MTVRCSIFNGCIVDTFAAPDYCRALNHVAKSSGQHAHSGWISLPVRQAVSSVASARPWQPLANIWSSQGILYFLRAPAMRSEFSTGTAQSSKVCQMKVGTVSSFTLFREIQCRTSSHRRRPSCVKGAAVGEFSGGYYRV